MIKRKRYLDLSADERRTERPAEAITPETQAPTKETINCSLQFFNREIKEGEMLSGPIILNDLLHLTKVSGRSKFKWSAVKRCQDCLTRTKSFFGKKPAGNGDMWLCEGALFNFITHHAIRAWHPLIISIFYLEHHHRGNRYECDEEIKSAVEA
uniref:Fork-head domain-containing protein n=1 Tax=Ascaris lumbricoides TaxID=6252 RepID=A0A0M3HSJ1_ASCLU